MNTRIWWFYRDSNNYKEFDCVVLPGTFTPEERLRVEMSLHEGEGFLPEVVGLWELQEGLQEFDVSDNRNADGEYDPYGVEGSDHVWHEFDFEAWVETEDPPTQGMTCSAFAAKFPEDGVWPWEDALCRLIGETRGSK